MNEGYQKCRKLLLHTTLTKDADPRGRSGSPEVDTNGYLVGRVSGAEGTLGVMASSEYLVHLFNMTSDSRKQINSFYAVPNY